MIICRKTKMFQWFCGEKGNLQIKVVINRCYGGFGLSNKALLELIKKNSEYIEKTQCNNDNKFIDYNDEYKQHKFMNILYKDNISYYLNLYKKYSKDFRTNKDLIEIIEFLGEKESSSRYANLKIIEIPDEVNWEIEEYDGYEKVTEIHKLWF